MTRFPRQVRKSVAVYHLAASGAQTYPGTASATIEGAFLPLDRRNAALEGSTFANPHELYTDPAADIRVTDKVVIDGITFYVKQIFLADFGGLAHKRCSISSQA